MTGVHARTNLVSTRSYFKRNSVSFSGIRVWEICGVQGLVVVGVVVLRFNTQHINCQGTREVFFTQIESNQLKALYYFLISNA